MDNEKIFANGLIFKRPHPDAPDFVKGKLSIKVSEFVPFLQQHKNNDWVNVDMKVSKSGNIYFELNTWKPDPTKKINSEDVPFI